MPCQQFRPFTPCPNGCTSSDAVSITVFPEPIVDIGNDTTLSLNQVLNLDAGPGFASYQWSTGDTTQSITVVVTQSEIYNVVVTDANGCIGSDAIFINTLVNALSPGYTQGFAVNIYPNPTKQILHIAVTKPSDAPEEIRVGIYNPLGQLVSERNDLVTGKESMFDFDFGNLPSGSYAIRVKIGSNYGLKVVSKI